MAPAITVDSVSKVYRINSAAPRRRRSYRTLRESMAHSAAAAWAHIRGQPGAGGPRDAAVRDFHALDGVSFEVEQGEVLGIIGRNGAGKSTLLKILSRITRPSSGRVSIHGRVQSLLGVGTGFHPELNGRENIFLNGSILGMSRREVRSRFAEIVEFSGVGDFLETPVKRYSSGMKVRLAFAVAAHLEPEILIVDEVLAVGDAEFQRRCLGRMRTVSRSGRTILFVSHNMAAVEGLCQRGLVLASGRVAFAGSQTDAVGYYMREVGSQADHARYSASPEAAAKDRPAFFREAVVTSGDIHSDAGYAVGAPLEIRIACVARQAVQDPSVAIGIDDSTGLRIATLRTDHDPELRMPPVARESWNLTCRLSALALTPGDYTIKLALQSNRQILDVVENTLRFTILPTDFYENGGKIGRGVVLCRQRWEHASA